MGTGIAGVLIVLVALLAMAAWYRSYRARGQTPPPERPPEAGLPEDRPTDWDPRQRYGDELPDAAERRPPPA